MTTTATVTLPPIPTKATPKATAPARLTLTLPDGTGYGVEKTGPDRFRLAKLAGRGDVYDVERGTDGINTCGCPHYQFRLKGNCNSGCKHINALISVGLLDPPGIGPS